MRTIKFIARCIDIVNTRVGDNVSYLVLPLMAIAMFEVVMRYAFNRPTLWAWDVNIQLQAAFIIMTGGYALLADRFVVVDVIVGRLSPRSRARLDLITSIIPLCAMAVLVWLASKESWFSFQNKETYVSTWGPPLYPLRFVVLIGVVLLFFQVVSRIIHILTQVLSKEGAS